MTTRPEFYSPQALAELLGVHRITIVREIERGCLHAFKVGERWRIPAGALEAYMGAKPAATTTV